ncbi:MAG: VWA domain-containing protein [Dehalococcoidia bacterium]|nr:MAG: VWA domain-containing protein [Dehalococcoidia bacterium]
MLNALGGGTAEEMVILRSRIGHLKFTAECFWALAIMGAVLSSVFLGVCAQSNDEGRSHSPASVSPYVRLQSQTQPVNVSIAQIDPSKFPIIELYALVTDQDGNSISGLTAGNFLVTEQSNLESSPTTESISVTPITGSGGITVALAFDKSGSMRGQPIIDAQAAANTFVDSLATLDRAAIISFGSPAVFHDPPAFTGDKDALHGIVNSLTDGGFTALYGAIYQAVTEINKEIGVKAVVIFSDGFSEGDTHTREQAVNLAKSSGVAVYTIGLGSNANESVLQIIADETGAYYTSSPTASDLQQIYDDIAQSIRDQYLVTYSTHNPNYDGTTRTVEVTATVGANSDSDSTTYSVTQPPQIDLTQDTTDLMSQAQYAGQALTIGAIITDDVLVTRAKLFYRKSGSGNIYTELEMTSSSDLYTADIPASGVVSPGVDFYVTATDGTLTSSVPQNNPATYPHQIAILPNQAPVIDHTPITTAAESTDIPISAKVTDTTDYVDHVKLFYRTSGYVLYDSLNMLPSSDTYTATIPGAKVTSAGVDYYIMASDNHTVKTYDGTDVSPHHINTANKLPVASAGPDQTITDTDGDGQESVTLDGSGSDDSDGTIANWVWTEGGTQIATGETPTVTLSVGTHTITLTVTDNDSATDTDEVTIVIASGHAVNSPSEPSGPRSGEADELLEFSTSISRCTKGHPVEYQFNWDSSGEDDLSEWSSSTSASHSYSSEGTYAVEA